MTDNRCPRCNLRLSIADIGPLCMFCIEMDQAKLTIAKGRHLAIDADGHKLCKCGGVVARWSTYECATCAAARVRSNRAAAKGDMAEGEAAPGRLSWRLR